MSPVLVTALVVAGIVLCGTGIWATVRVAAAADSVKRLADDLQARTPELLDKADVTVDALNAELLRVDLIVTQVEEVTELVSSASSTVHTIVNAPHEVMVELGEKLRRSLNVSRKHRERHEPDTHAGSEQQPAPQAEDGAAAEWSAAECTQVESGSDE